MLMVLKPDEVSMMFLFNYSNLLLLDTFYVNILIKADGQISGEILR